jgi:hypothetical protein
MENHSVSFYSISIAGLDEKLIPDLRLEVRNDKRLVVDNER